MSHAEIPFGDGRAVLVDPASARNVREQIQINAANRKWLERLVTIYEEHDRARKDADQ